MEQVNSDTPFNPVMASALESAHDGTMHGSSTTDVRVVEWLRQCAAAAWAYFESRTRVKPPAVEGILTMLSFPRSRPIAVKAWAKGEQVDKLPFLHDVIPAGDETLSTQETSASNALVAISPLAVAKGTATILNVLVHAALELVARPEPFNDKDGVPRIRRRTKVYTALARALNIETKDYAPIYNLETSATAAWAKEAAAKIGDPPEIIINVARNMKEPAKKASKTKSLTDPGKHVSGLAGNASGLEANPVICEKCLLDAAAKLGLDTAGLEQLTALALGARVFVKPEAEEVKAEEPAGGPAPAPEPEPAQAPEPAGVRPPVGEPIIMSGPAAQAAPRGRARAARPKK